MQYLESYLKYDKYFFLQRCNGTAHFKNVNNYLNTNIYSYLRDIW